MTTALLIATIILNGFVLLLAWQILRKSGSDSTLSDLEGAVREELRSQRQESNDAAKGLREEISSAQKNALETLTTSVTTLGASQNQKLEAVEKRVQELTKSNEDRFSLVNQTLEKRIRSLQESNEQKLTHVTQESTKSAKHLREEVSAAQKNAAESLTTTIRALGQTQNHKLETVEKRVQELTKSNGEQITVVQQTLERRTKALQESNEKKLEQMRQTVDEKLQSTLEKRLGESFKQVSERLEAVQRGLGEMQTLAKEVGGLQRVLTNVKARGTWGEIQLGAILEQILTPDQYEKNVSTKQGSADHVEFAIKLPGADDHSDSVVWLPVDSKFPQEDYLRLQTASDNGDVEGAKKAAQALARAVENAANDIAGKYVDPPNTTDFAILFLPTEGLYAEVLRVPGLVEKLQTNNRVVVTGPTTFSATISSLRMGFRTLAIEKRSSEVWQVLAAVKTEFGKFEAVLTKVQKQLQSASTTIEKTGVRTRAMERKLRDVESLPDAESQSLLDIGPECGDLDDAANF